MARILGFQSPGCQESALHELGHWRRDHERQVCAIMDGFLAANPDLDDDPIVPLRDDSMNMSASTVAKLLLASAYSTHIFCRHQPRAMTKCF